MYLNGKGEQKETADYPKKINYNRNQDIGRNRVTYQNLSFWGEDEEDHPPKSSQGLRLSGS